LHADNVIITVLADHQEDNTQLHGLEEVSKNQNASGDTINMLFMKYLVKRTSLEMKHCCLTAFMSVAHL